MNKLAEKSKAIRFDEEEKAPPAPVAVAKPERPRTSVGAISASLALGRGVESENKVLRERLKQFEGARLVEMLDPKSIVPSRMANRHELSFGGADYAALRDDIAGAGGNVQPIKVRRRAGQGPAYEVVYGHRRHRACLDLGIPVAAIVEDVDDRQLFVEMERENRQRENLSAWEQGVMYKRALDSNLFPSLRQLASTIGAQPGNVSTAIQLASLPEEVLAAFANPLELQFRWARPLKDAIERDEPRMLAEARAIASASPRPSTREAYDRLTARSRTASLATRPIESSGRMVGRVDRDAKGGVQLTFLPDMLSEAAIDKLVALATKLTAK